ncbi:MAG TPA: Uma2 family endonuclease [Jiangellaceae bacterium]
MTSMAVMPRATEWTVDDLEHLPDDGLQYELLDGILLVTPAPVPAHQAVAGELYVRLRAACPPHLKVFFAPLDWQPDRRTSLQPDLLVIPRDDIGLKNLTRPLALAVEVLSPSTWRKDQVLKYSKYADSDVGSYWIVDPTRPSIVAFDLVDETYVEVARAQGPGPFSVAKPYPVSFVPDDLLDL